MTTTSAFPTLLPQEDSMEMSSPGQIHDTDIDLDFGDGAYDGGATLHEDEHMLTDGEHEHTRPATATDDPMDDDFQAVEIETTIQEADMQDTPDLEVGHQQEDEELIDYGDDDIFDQQEHEDTTLVNAIEDVGDLTVGPGDDTQQVDEEPERHLEDASHEQPPVFDIGSDTIVAEAAYADESSVTLPAHESALADEQQQSFEADEAQVSSAVAEEVAGAGVSEHQHDGVQPAADDISHAQDVVPQAEALESAEQVYEGESATAQPSLALDTASYAAQADGPGTPTDTGLHPMTLLYGNLSCPLFKSKNQPDGLLKDDNLASLSLHELISNCRQRLALRIGNQLPEEQELSLAFDHVGLMLVENSRAAFEHSLNDVLEVYLYLHQNDGVQDIPTLSLTLTHQQFSNQLAMLKQAAEVGRGMSDFVPQQHEEDHEYNDETEERYDEDGEEATEYENQEAETQYEEGVADEAHADQHFADGVAHEETSYEYQEGEGYTGQEYTENAEDAAESDKLNALEQEVAALAAEAEVAEAENAEGEAAQSTQADNATAVDTPALSAEADEHPDAVGVATTEQESHDDAQRPASQASSDTLEGEHTATGEYDEDYIDWDDDSSLTSIPSEPTVDGKDDLSAFHEEPEAEHAQSQDDLDGQELGGESAVAHPIVSDEVPQYFGSEDFLNEHDEEHEDDAAADDAEQNQDQEGGDTTQYGEHHDQADTHDEQHEESFFQPGDEEQYQTAQDNLEGGDYEHGLEHVPNGEDYTGREEAPEDDVFDGEDPGQLDFGDDIGFDDQTTEEYEASKSVQPAVATSGSPLGKRSFDEAAEDDLELDEPESKKIRSE